jgi:hypothetical protein
MIPNRENQRQSLTPGKFLGLDAAARFGQRDEMQEITVPNDLGHSGGSSVAVISRTYLQVTS